ncbi:flagellar hook-length control protein FliK [Vibrio echinoideorum]|uniref:Flagellar hook-length control protein FliK n=1 Tax=Vibrio echinoideorum TaxID=2100116 RepID=A0ABU9FVT4_9VIBR
MENIISGSSSKAVTQLESKITNSDIHSLNTGNFNEIFIDSELLSLDSKTIVIQNPDEESNKSESESELEVESELTEEYTYVDVIDEGNRVLNELGNANKLLVNGSTEKSVPLKSEPTVENEIKKSSKHLEKNTIIDEQKFSGKVEFSLVNHRLIPDVPSLKHQETEANLVRRSLHPLEISEEKKVDFDLVPQVPGLSSTQKVVYVSPTEQPMLNHDVNENIKKQILEKVQISVDKNLKNIDIRLDPPELGKVNIRLTSHNDTTSIHFVVSNPNTKELIEMTLHRVRDLLANSGVSIDQATVQQQSSDNSNTNSNGEQHGGWASDHSAIQDDENITSLDVLLEADSGHIDFYA